MPEASAAPTSRRDLEDLIIKKAWSDRAYREKLMRDPRQVLQEELQAIDPEIVLPEGLVVQLHEENPAVFHFVMPMSPDDVARLGSEKVAVETAGISRSVNVFWAVNANVTANVNANFNANVNANANANANVNANWNANYNAGASGPLGGKD